MPPTVAFNQRPARPKWGVRPTTRKAASLKQAIRTMPAPQRVVIPVEQCLGFVAEPLVGIGDRVLTGQPIAGIAEGSGLSPQIHATISGVVHAIEPRAVPGTDGAVATCIVIESDGKDEACERYLDLGDPLKLTRPQLCEAIAEAGIVGLGGALFSTATKLAAEKPVDLLLLNGAECEPYITCDEILLREHASHVIRGAEIMRHAVGAREIVIAVESDMAEARVAVFEAIDEAGANTMHVSVVTAKYPAGGERQLIQLVTDREVPEAGIPADIGVLCQNIGTAAAVADLFDRGRPLISRIVTVTGRGINEPINVEARLGTPIKDLIEIAGGYTEDVGHLIMGGPMMGIALDDDTLPVTKACNCILVMKIGDVSPSLPEMPCIRCGECAEVCPAQLLPQELLISAGQNDMVALNELGIMACIECGCCDYVCPSQIPLTQRFVDAKKMTISQRQAADRAEHARERTENRTERLAAENRVAQQELERQAADAEDPGMIDTIMDRVNKRDE